MKRYQNRLLWVLALFSIALFLGCGAGETSDSGDQVEPAEVVEPTEDELSEGSEPQVFFEEPEDGASVAAMPAVVALKFGARNFTIEPVGEGMVHAGHGHYHVGLDTDCLPAGTVIPTADPWIHFGLGQDEIEYTLPAGSHTLTLQIGDGEHRTLDEPGLCNTITVSAEESDTDF